MLFQTTRNILFELKAAARIGEVLARESACKRVLVVSDPGIQSAGLLTNAIQSIEQAGGSVSLFLGVSPDPTEANVLAATKQAIESEATAVRRHATNWFSSIKKLKPRIFAGCCCCCCCCCFVVRVSGD